VEHLVDGTQVAFVSLELRLGQGLGGFDVRQFIGGLLLGSLLTITAGLLIGPEVTLSNVGSGNSGNHSSGRYDVHTELVDGETRYVMVDTVKGIAFLFDGKGQVITVRADEDNSTQSVP